MKIVTLLGGSALLALSIGVYAATDTSLAPAQDAINVLQPGEVSFKRDVQPILHDYCISCHNPSSDSRGYVKSGLDLTSYESLMKGTKFGKVIVPGDSEASTFTKLLTGTNKGLKMPMGLNAGGTLDRQYILTLRKWVKQGAKNN
ncbi:MAG: c-type cytochrome domain-containing protein [Sideroxyarcus sp.]|nr:c-type cytochrome domain-containing protein [Sideroxyarcus sp.]